MRTEALESVKAIAARNLGFVPLLQAKTAGITADDLDDLTAAGLLENWVGKDIWLYSESDFPEFPQLVAAWIMLEPTMPAEQRKFSPEWVVSRISAAHMHGLVSSPPETYHFTTPKGAIASLITRASARKIQIHPEDLAPTEIDYGHLIPCTTPLRTFADLAHDGNVSVRVLADIAAKLIKGEIVSRTELLSPAYDYMSKITAVANGREALIVLLENSKLSVTIPELSAEDSHDFR